MLRCLNRFTSVIAAGLCAFGGLGVMDSVLAQSSLSTPIERSALAKDAFSSGPLSEQQGAFRADLWQGASIDSLAVLLDAAPSKPQSPSLGAVLRKTLLSPGVAPEGAPISLGGRKLVALARAGFYDQAASIAALSDAPRGDPWVSRALAIADLLRDDHERACRRSAGLSGGRDEAFWLKMRVFCYTKAGENAAADLTLGLLREQGSLTDADEVFLSALAFGAAPKTPPSPQTALHLASAKRLKLPISPSLLKAADAGVLTAIAKDKSIDPAARVTAVRRAAALGAVGGAVIASVYDDIPLEDGVIEQAVSFARERRHEPLADVVLYRSIKLMSAPEFLRDKAALIAEALNAADGFERFYAAASLYEADMRALDGALITPDEAMQFARARMLLGDAHGGAQWLYAILGAESVDTMDENQAMMFIETTNFLSVLDPARAADLAEAAAIELSPVSFGGASDDVDHSALTEIMRAAFSASRERIVGQAALSALAASNIGSLQNEMVRVIVDQSLIAAGLEGIGRRVAFETALRGAFAENVQTLSVAADQQAGIDEPSGFVPSLKPPRNQ